MMEIKMGIDKKEHEIIFSDAFFNAMQALGVHITFRMDRFSELETSPYTYFSLNATVIQDASLDAIESMIAERQSDNTCSIPHPNVVGMIAYEQAAEFLPIELDSTAEKGVCIFPNILLAVHQTLPEAYLMGLTKTQSAETIKMYEGKVRSAIALSTPMAVQEKEGAAFTGYQLHEHVTQNKDDAAYGHMLTSTIHMIEEGEIFQAVLSRRYDFSFDNSPYTFYRTAMSRYGMPYNCFIQPTKAQAFAITSPEMLVAYDHEIVRTRPIAGTRPIKNDGKDDIRRSELVQDEKENAEHLMLVDLGRNDLAKVSAPGTVKLNFYKEVKPYHKVYHMVSEVVGKRDFKKVFDPIRATFPAGTVSGAPKIRAMEIIKSLENEPRKAYAGATYVIDESGRFTSCINIRCATFENGVAQIQVGSGIVYDSIVESERKELLNKIRGHLETMERMGNGHVFAH
ncbi:MAG: anthranilate synthase component [Clostridiales bacterium]|nr:anthranilate synthase component [Clostridiales bacterium]MDN5298358.1 anthranilate synthase component [Clostridiales bacterium]